MPFAPLILSPQQVSRFENHDEAYHRWRSQGFRQRVLLHVDAHHDMYGDWEKPHSITIANFILPAVAEDIVREIIWALPDETWNNRTGRSYLRRTIQSIRNDGWLTSEISENRTSISTSVLGKPLTLCPIKRLPDIREPVLLDLDVDFLVTPNIGYRGFDFFGRLPWLWPVELLDCLANQQIQSDYATIAYSVEGGYTPPQWKYLGDELAFHLQPHTETNAATRQGFESMRTAATSALRGDHSAAEMAYLEAKKLLPTMAAPDLHLAHLYSARGQPRSAREHYESAVELDESYRTAYNSSGIAQFRLQRWKGSRQAHQRTLALDPDDAYAHLGLGLLSLRTKEWSVAQAHFAETLRKDESSVDALRGLGRALGRQGDIQGAIEVLERSLKYALLGHEAIMDGLISTEHDHVRDGGHGRTHAALAGLYAELGNATVALAGYQMGIAAGADSVGTRFAIARLHLRMGDWREALAALGAGLRGIPTALRQQRRRYRHTLGRFLAREPHRRRLRTTDIETPMWV